jgi:amidohydrolase
MPSQSTWVEQLDQAVDANQQLMVEVRRHLHAYPEVSGEEVQTTRYLSEQLREHGFDMRVGPEGRGLIVDLPAKPGSRVALRGDIDALRIQDAKSVDYRSRTQGVMHACGHDAHAAVVLGALVSLSQSAKSLGIDLPIRGVFQPAEESNTGALEMIDAGALNGVTAILGLHMDPKRRVGTIGYRRGAFTADCDEMHIDIRGRGGHASRPHEVVDPIAAAAQMINSIYLFTPRVIDSHDPVVVSIGRINGGESYNVIPDHVELLGTLRSFGGEIRQRTKDHIAQLARGIAEVSDTTISVEFTAGPPSVYNDAKLNEVVRTSAVELLGREHVHAIERPSMGGEDFAHYLAHVPGAMFRLGCAPSDESAPPLHSADFDIDERALSVGANILAR